MDRDKKTLETFCPAQRVEIGAKICTYESNEKPCPYRKNNAFQCLNRKDAMSWDRFGRESYSTNLKEV